MTKPPAAKLKVEKHTVPVARAHDVSFAYDRELVLDGVSFTVYSGETVAVIGPNGGGKSTLVKLLLGLIEPQRGTLQVFGKRPAMSRGKIGYVPQYSQFDTRFPINVREVVLTGLVRPLIGRHTRLDRTAAEEALERVGMSGLGKHSFAELSGGQRQRVLIARALVGEPSILLLDEPTANVDSFMSDRFLELIVQLAADRTVFFVTHDTGYVSAEADRVFCINRTLKEHPVEALGHELVDAAYGRPMSSVLHHVDLHAAT